MTLTELIQKERIKVAKEEGLQQGIEKGIEQGIEKGEATGISKERRKVIMNLLIKDFSIDDIIEILGYEKEEVKTIFLEYQVRKMLKDGLDINKIMEKLNVSEELVLKIKNDLAEEKM